MTVTEHNNALSQSFVYLVSPRGGNSYWAVVINGCDKLYVPGMGTCAVTLTPNGRYTLSCDPEFFGGLSDPMKKLVLVHEAGHIAMRHPERACKLLAHVTDPSVRESVTAVFNIAADFAINDSIVRNEPEFAAMLANQEFNGLLPERYGLPTGKSMEQYMALLVKNREELKDKLRDILGEEPEDSEGDGEDDSEGDGQGEGEGDGQGEGEGEGEGEGQAKSKGTGGRGSESKGKKKKRRKSKGATGDEKGDALREAVVEAIADALGEDPNYFKRLKEAFDKAAGKSHGQWNETANELSPEESVSMANKLKQHAKRLVKSAHDQVKTRGRGFLPGNVDKLVGTLLAEEQTPWTWLFNDVIATAIAPKVIEEMACPNLMMINDEYVEPWPGMALDQEFNITWLTDTSGSMSDPEYARACVEVNGLLRVNKNIRMRYMECDAIIQKEMMVDNLQPPEEASMQKLRYRRGYGGTVYSPAFRRICGLDTAADWAAGAEIPTERPPKPDLVVVVTDGGVCIEGEVFPQYHPGCPIVWLITPGHGPVPGMNDVPPDHVIKMFSMKTEEE